jgi:itaconyl-CoA hydratase
MLKPVFAGDTLYSVSWVREKQDFEKCPTQAIVTVTTFGKKHQGKVVCKFIRTMLIWKKGFGPMES